MTSHNHKKEGNSIIRPSSFISSIFLPFFSLKDFISFNKSKDVANTPADITALHFYGKLFRHFNFLLLSIMLQTDES